MQLFILKVKLIIKVKMQTKFRLDSLQLISHVKKKIKIKVILTQWFLNKCAQLLDH